jgi:tetratricopeptide (TPR) repeat protein
MAATMGRSDAAFAASRRAVALDPLNTESYFGLGWVSLMGRRYEETIAAGQQALSLNPAAVYAYRLIGEAEYLLGNIEHARTICEAKQEFWDAQMCLAFAYQKLGRHDAAATMLAKLRSRFGEAGAYGYTEIYAQWGDIRSALDWLEKAYRLRDTDLLVLKADPMMDPLRREPRFLAVIRELQFPD